MFKTIAPLSLIVGMRFFGLFVVLPIISIYALSLKDSTSILVGVSVGVYALTQVLFQVPFGILSDKIGRKKTIVIGLIIFTFGSIVCAISDNIYTLIIGRFLQGSGAIAAVVTAMISDLVREEQRPRAMAIMGGIIALSFALSMVLGPTLGSYFGVYTLFWITAILAILSIIILLKLVPNPPKIIHSYNKKLNISMVLSNSKLIKMNITNFLQKSYLTFAFTMIPIVLIKKYGWDTSDLYKIYLPSMVAGLLAMGPAAIYAEKKGKFKEVLIFGVVLFAISFFIIGFNFSSLGFLIGVIIFFIAFNTHEPIMQSLVTKYAKVHQRGVVLGVFNSFGYLGTFVGGLIAGFFLDTVGLEYISNTIAIVSIFWIILIATLPNPLKMKLVYISKEDINEKKICLLNNNIDIHEWYINNTENLVVVKYDIEVIDESKIRKLLV